jgi:alkaline phosphatase
MIKTHNIDGKFPDSAPTATAYATGVKTKAPYLGIDSSAAPQISVLELAKLRGLSTGIVVTCEFPHATPAAFVCHFNSRESGKYKNLARQFVYNSPDVVFSGGLKFVESNQLANDLNTLGFKLVTDLHGFNNIQDDSVWALLPDCQGNTRSKSYACDRNPATEPGLPEMTQKAINLLSRNTNGFFLMVEGSQIDWACHNNDPYAAVTEFIEFDKALKVALDFAAANKNTVVIVCPDHGNGGLTMGNMQSHVAFHASNPYDYGNINIYNDIITPLKENSNQRVSGRRLAEMIVADPKYAGIDSIKKYYNLDDIELFNKISRISAGYPPNDLIDTIQYILGSSFSNRNFLGWTTTGHTADDVFLGIYAPDGVQKLGGVVDNSDIGKYIASIIQLGNMNDSTAKYFSPHTSIFKSTEIKQINQDSLVVVRNGMQMVIYANTNMISIKQKNKTRKLSLPTIAICINKANNKFVYYLFRNIEEYLK